ncbi:hypothetical protein H2203_006097 [Taxawa tesnikishii (nom. ined.)]|nr:hypothetical protein H2203_006097 [Dothideales sp. JES 119]
MSSDSLAMFRKSMGTELGNLAEEHYKHDLQQSDRDTLKSAASKISTHATIGSLVGLGLGLYAAYKLRANRTAMFNAFKASEKPTHVQFANGRTGAQPCFHLICGKIMPSTLGDVATYTFFGFGGLFFGGETGLLTGSYSANRAISRDPESRKRIETAFRRFRADVLRTEATMVEKGQIGLGI